MNTTPCVKVIHIYQRTVNGHLLFYTVSDFLVFFTTFCSTARRYGIRVIGVCPMYDHLHVLVEVCAPKQLAVFVQAYSHQYSEEFNLSIGSSGSIFSPRYGRAERSGLKEVRSACSYVYNNPGEKDLCKRAEEYRWTFLAYAESKHPFSEPIVLSAASAKMRRAVKTVDYYRKYDKPLRYSWLRKMFDGLVLREKQQLTDYIIRKYNCIDYKRLLSFYDDSYEKACLAFASNQGKEFGLKEEFVPGSHKAYMQIMHVIRQYFGITNIKDIFVLPQKERDAMAKLCRSMTSASKRQIVKFFRGGYLLASK